MTFWQYVLMILGALGVAVSLLWWVVLPIGDLLTNRQARKRRAAEREEYTP